MSRSLPGNVPAGLVTRASPDMCSGRGCQGVSLVARECSRGFGDESEPGHVLWDLVVKLLKIAVVFLVHVHNEICLI